MIGPTKNLTVGEGEGLRSLHPSDASWSAGMSPREAGWGSLRQKSRRPHGWLGAAKVSLSNGPDVFQDGPQSPLVPPFSSWPFQIRPSLYIGSGLKGSQERANLSSPGWRRSYSCRFNPFRVGSRTP